MHATQPKDGLQATLAQEWLPASRGRQEHLLGAFSRCAQTPRSFAERAVGQSSTRVEGYGPHSTTLSHPDVRALDVVRTLSEAILAPASSAEARRLCLWRTVAGAPADDRPRPLLRLSWRR